MLCLPTARICFLALGLIVSCSLGADVPKPSTDSKGDWVKLSKDGIPWTHPDTGLIFPQMLGDFALQGGYRDKRANSELAITYTKKESNIKADVLISPCKENLATTPDVMAVARKELEKLAADLTVLAGDRGYKEQHRSPVSDGKLPLWEKGEIPFISMTLGLVPSAAGASQPAINQWLAVLLYRDHYVQFNVIMPSDSIQKNKAEADQLITNLLQCVRYPALVPEMLKICRSYLDEPLTDSGRASADALTAFSKERPIFEIIYPGEALTAALDEISARSKDAALELLRAFTVGSGVVTLQNGTADESLEEGARIMLGLREMMKERTAPVESDFLDELAKASDAKRGAAFLREKMRAIPPAP
jgi:hypothetical protein